MPKSSLPRRDYTSDDYSLDDIPEIPAVPAVPAQTPAQAHDQTSVQSDSHTGKQVSARSPRGKGKAKRAEPDPVSKAEKRYVQRPIYASEEMIEAVRKLTYERKKPAQEYYREGLLLRLQQEGLFKGLTFEDL